MHPFPDTKHQKELEESEEYAMPQALGRGGSNGSQGSLKRVWDVKILPHPEYARRWQSILRSKDTKQDLLHYAAHTKELIDHAVPRSALDLSGVVLLCGPPGVGKTTLAHGFANEYARTMGQPTRLFALHTERVFSELLGQSPKQLAKAFEGIRFAAEQAPVVMVVDEIERISYARNKVINTSDPTDLVRFVDQLLTEIDSLQQYDHALVVGTSNFAQVIDQALWSRADLVLKMGLPDVQTRQAILQDRLKTLQPLGLMLQSDEVLALAKAAEGLSGRTLGKLFPNTYFKGVAYDEMSAEDVLATITQALMEENDHGSC
jgi:SpoVK/Ycf46/Vps4 family AAA+-type ATPase